MKLFSTKKAGPLVTFEEAIFQGLPPDNGLYMPEFISVLSGEFWDKVGVMSIQEIAFEITKAFLKDDLSDEVIQQIIDEAITFDAPLAKLNESLYCLELFHGSSMAFKDFGARFMASIMSYFLRKSDQKLNILVATSGDTGGAVAQGFYNKANISVTILYPKGKVSEIQEKQLTTLGGNISALEVDGTFDDCQALVKQAFLDLDLKSKFGLASANSINIARLIPQSFYYVYAFSRLQGLGKEIVFSVPSGNFGNLTAGLIAQKMGMPVKTFIAATNVNKVVPSFIESGEYLPISPSISTISNAMDVGNPSNFPRMESIFNNDINQFRDTIKGCYFTDEETKDGIKELKEKFDYLACPHTAIAYLGLKKYSMENSGSVGVFLSTAHFAKFLPDMEKVLGYTPQIPKRLSDLIGLEKSSTEIKASYDEFKEYLLQNLI